MRNNISNTYQAFWFALASLLSFSFSIISAAVLSRYFEKADYGTYKQVLYIYSTLLVIFTLGLPKAYSFFLPRTENRYAKDVINKITKIFVLLGACFSAVLYLGAASIASILRNNELEVAIKIFSLVPLFLLPTMGLESIFSVYRKTHYVAIYTVITRVFMLLCIVLPVIIFNTTFKGALIGFTISSFLSFLVALYLKHLPVREYSCEKSKLKYSEIFSFSLPVMVASIWGILELSSNQFFVSRYFGTEVFAEFSNGAIELPLMATVIGATSAVLAPVFSKMSYEKVDLKKDLYPLWIRVLEKSVLLTYPVLIFSIVFAKEIMVLLYGEMYENSAIYFQIFNLYFFLKIIVYGPYLISTGRQKMYANAHMYSVLVLIPLQFAVLYIINSPVALIIVALLVKILRTFYFIKVIAVDFNIKVWQLLPIKLMVKILVPCFIFSILIKGIINFNFKNLNYIEMLVISALVYFIIYSCYAVTVKINYKSIIKPLISNKVKSAK
ncbi:oligosaccharide flippase family protein [Acinetobacter towneri]|uniref:oligosaccharide flippase family protein n=1 Tax=Acinetobacter towneri TaxID=202956 RepID=UPI0014446EF0|nr:oligosaccharide flippase family protein [Acinetobacter towneri]